MIWRELKFAVINCLARNKFRYYIFFICNIGLLAYWFIFSVSPVGAQEPCTAPYVCCYSVDRCIRLHGEYSCGGTALCCEACGTLTEEGIINPVIDWLGRGEGEEVVGYLLASFIRVAYLLAGIMVLIYFIWGAIEWLISGGVPENIAKAQARIANALVGLVILAFTYVVLAILGMVLKIDFLRLVLPSPIQ